MLIITTGTIVPKQIKSKTYILGNSFLKQKYASNEKATAITKKYPKLSFQRNVARKVYVGTTPGSFGQLKSEW
jgi:hypothetical protein